MPKVLVTGACGFIGFHVAKKLVSLENFSVIALDSLHPFYRTQLTSIRRHILKECGVTLLEKDLVDPNLSLEQQFTSVDLIVHLAAFPGVRIDKGQEEMVLENNVVGFERIAKYARTVRCPLIYASSSSVYGNQALEGACQEIHALEYKGLGAYALSKWKNETLAQQLLKSGDMESVGLRLFSVIGEFGREDMAYFKFAKLLAEGSPIRIFSSLEDERDYTPIKVVTDDILELALMAIYDNEIFSRHFSGTESVPFLNVGTGVPRKLSEIIRFYSSHYGTEAKIILESRLPVESKKTWSDNLKRNAILSKRQNYNFEDCLTSFLKWLEESKVNL